LENIVAILLCILLFRKYPLKTMNVQIRKVTLNDVERIKEIYNHYIVNTVHTFEAAILTDEQVAQRINKYQPNYPWYVAESDNTVIGYAYASEFIERTAYKFTSEVTIFIDKNYTKGGAGKKLLAQLVKDMSTLGYTALISIIAVPNPASVKLHKAFGFENVGHLKKVGYKLGKWVDVELWELELHQ
jgi:L-amino acid N-acyltransferase YncA